MYGDLKKQFVKQLRKHLSFICLFFAIVAAVAFTGIAGPAAAEDNGGTLRLINPEIFLKGIRIKHIVATLDGADFGGCWADRRQPNNLCIKPQPISAGPHVLEILLDPLTSTYFTWVHKFNAAMSGDWTLDLQGVAERFCATARNARSAPRPTAFTIARASIVCSHCEEPMGPT